MFRLISLLLLCSIPVIASAEFSCDMIKDKVVRKKCLSERQDSSKARDNEFYKSAKYALTENFLDPEGAQLSELSIVSSSHHKALCGKINAKNSFGAYTGKRKFYITYERDPEIAQLMALTSQGENSHTKLSNNGDAYIWISAPQASSTDDSPKTIEIRAKLEEIEQQLAENICGGEGDSHISKISP